MIFLRSDQLPWWVLEVCEALDKPTALLDHGAELGLVAAVKDALAWTRDRRRYESRHKASWESVIDDFGATVGRLGTGSELGRAISTELASAVGCLKMPEGNPEETKKRAEVALESLSSRAMDSTIVIAAWEDLIGASQDPTVLAPEWAWRRNLFLEVAAHAGRDVTASARTLVGILDDRLVDVTSARAQLQELEAPSRGGWPRPDENAGLTETARLDLCARLLGTDPVPTRCVVCVGFDHARLSSRVNVTDNMVFYPAVEAKELVGVGDPTHSGPIALIPTDAATSLPNGDDEVVAVVDLGTINPATAVATGVANCEAVVALVNAGLREPDWRPMTGHILSANGWSARGFAPSGHSRPPRWDDLMRTRLESLGARIDDHLPVTAPTLQSVVEASHRLLASQNEAVDPSGRLLLTVRVIEDAAGWSSGDPMKWHKFAGSLDGAWAEATVRGELFRVVSKAVGPFAGDHLEEPEQQHQLESLRSVITTDQPDNTFDFNVRAAYENLPALAQLYPVGCAQGRQLATLQQYLADGPSLAGHLSQRSDGYRRLLARAVRCRNAAAHGGPLPSHTVASVLDWARVVVSSLRNAAIEILLTESGPDSRARIAEEYRRMTEEPSKRKGKLGLGAGIAETLFSSEEA